MAAKTEAAGFVTKDAETPKTEPAFPADAPGQVVLEGGFNFSVQDIEKVYQQVTNGSNEFITLVDSNGSKRLVRASSVMTLSE